MIVVDKNCNYCGKDIKVPKSKTVYGAKYFYCSYLCKQLKVYEKGNYGWEIRVKRYEHRKLAKKTV